MIKTFRLSRTGKAKKSYTEKNPFWNGPERPKTIEISESDEGEIELSTVCAMGRMFAQAFNVQMIVPFWEALPDGELALLEPKFLVEVLSPKNRINDSTEMVIRNITYNKTSESQSATLLLSLDTYGVVPETLPWL